MGHYDKGHLPRIFLPRIRIGYRSQVQIGASLERTNRFGGASEAKIEDVMSVPCRIFRFRSYSQTYQESHVMT